MAIYHLNLTFLYVEEVSLVLSIFFLFENARPSIYLINHILSRLGGFLKHSFILKELQVIIRLHPFRHRLLVVLSPALGPLAGASLAQTATALALVADNIDYLLLDLVAH
jgi:hypothetical protein